MSLMDTDTEDTQGTHRRDRDATANSGEMSIRHTC